MISIISPVFNEAESLKELVERVSIAMKRSGQEFEYILVENGSKDNSLALIKELRSKDPRVKFVSLSRNFGHQGAIMAGLAHASGDAVISLDGDLQQPPELIPELIRLWKEGHEIVYTVKKIDNANKSWQFFLTVLFYRMISVISDIKLTFGQSDFRLLDRKVVDTILRMPEKKKFLRGIVEWVGFSQIGVEYEVGKRKSGRSKFSFFNYMNFALDGIFSFTTMPLRFFLWSGLIIAFFCLLWGAYYVIMGMITLLYPQSNLLPPGSATITVGILFLGAVQLIGIGCLGEYIGRIYYQVKERPDFIVKEKQVG